MGWVKNLSTSTLTFNIAHFFPLPNHCLLTLILKKVRFDNCVTSFFTNYLVDKKTNYFWNNFISPIFNINVGVGQGSVLSPILLALYLSSFLYILENHLKILKFRFLSYPLLMIDFLFLKANNLTPLTVTFFVATMF